MTQADAARNLAHCLIPPAVDHRGPAAVAAAQPGRRARAVVRQWGRLAPNGMLLASYAEEALLWFPT
ncbi:hypothetical protein AB0K68_24660 [Streptomyces sp. NPDC050698]